MIDRRYRKIVILFLLPASCLYLFLFIYPSIRAFHVSLFDWNGFTANMTFIGINNFKELFINEHFWNVVFKNTVRIIFIGGLLIFAIAFTLSGVLSTNLRAKKLFRAIIFFPAVINPVAIAILWSFIYNKQWGLLNGILGGIGLKSLQQTWTSPDNLFWAILFVLVWTYTGFFCVILLAALDRIPKGLIEAAQIEGANEVIIFFTIKLQLIWDVLITSMILWGITAIKEFAVLYAWGGSVATPPDGVQNLAIYMYITAFGKRISIYRMGYATSMGVLMFLMVVVLYLAIYLPTKRETVEY